MPSHVRTRDNLDQLGLDYEVEGVRKATKQVSAGSLVHGSMDLRFALNRFQSGFYSEQELSAKSEALLLVPCERRLDVLFSGLPEDK